MVNPSLKHIAIICDGNRRWAKGHGLPEFAGHQQAVNKTMKALVDHCLKLKIPFLSFWVLSTENWRRGQNWMRQYFKLLRSFMKKDAAEYIQKGVKLNLIGDLSRLPVDIQKLLNEWVEKSRTNTHLTFTIAINYGGRDEIIRAIERWRSNLKLKTKNKKLTEQQFSQYLDTKNLPEPELLIRPGGQQRLSGFMLWQLAYTELYFTPTLFPDFTPQELDQAISWFKQQKRNFGQ
jgi:undecaprenyl diphosphate synthase